MIRQTRLNTLKFQRQTLHRRPVPILICLASFGVFEGSLSWLAFAQKDHSNCRYENENPNDLKRQIVIAEKQRADVPDIVNCRSCERRKSPAGGLKVANDQKNLDE